LSVIDARSVSGFELLIEERLAKYARLIEERWRSLSDGERLTLMALCCRYCGTLELPCWCDPAYDR